MSVPPVDFNVPPPTFGAHYPIATATSHTPITLPPPNMPPPLSVGPIYDNLPPTSFPPPVPLNPQTTQPLPNFYPPNFPPPSYGSYPPLSSSNPFHNHTYNIPVNKEETWNYDDSSSLRTGSPSISENSYISRPDIPVNISSPLSKEKTERYLHRTLRECTKSSSQSLTSTSGDKSRDKYIDKEKCEYRESSCSSSYSSRKSPSQRRRSPSYRYHSRSPSSHRRPSSPSYRYHRHSRSPSRHSPHRDKARYYREKERESYYRDKERYYREKEKERYYREKDKERYYRHKEKERYIREKYHEDKERRRRYESGHTSMRRISHSHDLDDRRSERSPSRRSYGKPYIRKITSDREKILEEYRKNYCQSSEDVIEKIEQWSKEQNEEEEGSKIWYRSSPAELYYKQVESGTVTQQTPKLEKLCDTFFKTLIERGRNARPEVDELPPLKPPRAKMCKHNSDDESSSSSSESDGCIDEDGLQAYTDGIMMELQRKQSHPRRLHPEMWFNNSGEMNTVPLCRCSVRARKTGMRHGVYAGEQNFAKCLPNSNNLDKLYHYIITVSPPTNFLIKAPTIISHDEHEFLFSGFSMFSHYELRPLPSCRVIRFNIEYTILYERVQAPVNFSVKELDLFEDFLFTEILELVDLDLGKSTDTSCSQFHFMPRFVRYLPEGGCEVLSMCEVLKYLIDESEPLISPDILDDVHRMDNYTWQKFVDRIKGMILTKPGMKPCCVRVDQLDRTPAPVTETSENVPEKKGPEYPEIVHFGIRPPQFSYAGNPEYQKAWRYYVKYRHLIANMAKPTFKERQKLAAKEAKLQEMRTQSKMKRDVTVAISSEGFHTTGLMCDIVQHAMLIPVLVRHLRFHKSLEALEQRIGHRFASRALLQTALTHPSYRENFGTNPDHARNSLTNCGIRQPEYGDRRIHYTRKKGIVTLINIMSRFGKHSETESDVKHNERLEFLGDAVVEFLSSIHLFRMFPGLAEGGLATYRASIVQNQHLAQLAKNIGLEQFMLYAHGSDLCRDVVMRHAMANCFEALMGALFLDAGPEVADRVFALALWHDTKDLYEVWMKERAHPLQEQEPLGDRKYIKDFEFLQKLSEFEETIGVQFKHIRLLARAFTDRSVGFTHLTLGSNQRLEFLGDTVLQLAVSDRLYKHFPHHHEGHLSLLRSSLVNNRTQSMVCDDLNMSRYAIYNNPKAKPTTKKHKADLLEAFLGALFIDKKLEYCQAFCNACLFPRLREFIMNQDWNDPKSKLQQCCLTLRSMEGGEPDIPIYKVIECLGPTNSRVYTVGVYFRGERLAAARGHSIQEAEMGAAQLALANAHELFPQLDHQKRVIAKRMKKKKRHGAGGLAASEARQKSSSEKVPKAYRLGEGARESSSAESERDASEEEPARASEAEDSGLDSDASLGHVRVSSLLSDMQRLKHELIQTNQYDKLKQKALQDSDADE